MKMELYKTTVNFLEERMVEYHKTMLNKIRSLKLKHILKRKNPYLFRAKGVEIAGDIVMSLLGATLSSAEETVFGGVLEELAVSICGVCFGGKKSAAEGVDMEFEREDKYYIVSIKSGPNWGNSSQIKRMENNFKKAKRILGTNTSSKNIIAVNGCCYGKNLSPDKGDYLKYCEQDFWEFISGISSLYQDIIEPLGHQAKQKTETFMVEYDKIVNRFTAEFSQDFCKKSGEIDWAALVKYNSQSSRWLE